MTEEHAQRAKRNGSIISSAFTVSQEDEDGNPKGRFVVNLSRQSKHWKKGTVRMESLAEFACTVQKNDHSLSMDIKSGYRHFRLAPAMRDWFIFRYNGRYFQCVALPFGWGRSPLWFTHFMNVFVKELRRLGYRVLPCLDDFLISPSPYGIVANPRRCTTAARNIDGVLKRLGLVRHPQKGNWTGACVMEHLGVIVDTINMKFLVAPRKVKKVRELARKLMKEVRHGRRWVSQRSLSNFCGVCVSLTLAMPRARFYTRSLYWDMSSSRPRDNHNRCRLSHQSIRDLLTWQRLSRQDLSGRPMLPMRPDSSVHTDATDVGYGGTVNTSDFRAGVDGEYSMQGIWNWKDRSETISYRELKAVRKLLMGPLGRKLAAQSRKNLLLHVDNMSVVHIINSCVSASRPMMRELRKLKRVLDHQGIQVKTEWLPSVANKFADALSRRFPRGDLRIRKQLRRSVQDGIRAPIDAFKYRPLGEHPIFMRQQAFAELEATWNREEVRLLCPPVELIGATVMKLTKTRAPAVLMIPDWPKQPWHAAAMRIAHKSETLELPAREIWDAQRRARKQATLARSAVLFWFTRQTENCTRKVRAQPREQGSGSK